MFKIGFEKTAGMFDSLKKAFTAAKAAPATATTSIKPGMAQAVTKAAPTAPQSKIPSYIREGVKSGKLKYIDVK